MTPSSAHPRRADQGDTSPIATARGEIAVWDRAATAPGGCRGLDVSAIENFIDAQSKWLRRGMAWSTDERWRQVVLAVHDCSHEAWLSLIAAVHRCRDGHAAATIVTLYTFHGRLARSLELQATAGLDPCITEQVRSLLTDRLATLTEEALFALKQSSEQSAATVSKAAPPVTTSRTAALNSGTTE